MLDLAGSVNPALVQNAPLLPGLVNREIWKFSLIFFFREIWKLQLWLVGRVLKVTWEEHIFVATHSLRNTPFAEGPGGPTFQS